MLDSLRVISADSHVVEPPDVWTERVPAKYRETAPRFVSDPAGDYWLIEGVPSPYYIGLPISAGIPPQALTERRRYQEGPPGAGDPDARLKELAADGVAGEVLYPTVALRIYRVDDLAYQDVCIRAYNAWMSEFCGRQPGHFRGLGLATLQDIDLGLGQLEQVKRLGLAGAMVSITPDSNHSFLDPEYARFWAAAAELALPLSLHIHTGRQGPQGNGAGKMVENTLLPTVVARSIAELIFGGVFERNPGLRVISAENDASWVANFQLRMDYSYTRRRFFEGFSLQTDVLPSEQFRRHVACTFMDDRPAILAREAIGVETMMWASDYPHTDSTYPHSRAIIARNLEGVSETEARAIAGGNAARWYGFDQ